MAVIVIVRGNAIVLHGPLDQVQRERLLQIANRCPVHRTLTSEIRISTRLAARLRDGSDADPCNAADGVARAAIPGQAKSPDRTEASTAPPRRWSAGHSGGARGYYQKLRELTAGANGHGDRRGEQFVARTRFPLLIQRAGLSAFGPSTLLLTTG